MKDTHKIEIQKENNLWTADLMKLVKPIKNDVWESVNQVSSDSYGGLQFEISDKGFLDLLNKQ